MYFGLSEDQVFFQDNVKKFLEDNAPIDVIRKIANEDDKTSKEDLHKGIITLGINNILIPEENGGLGLDLLFATAVSQSLGEGIATLPFTGSYVMAPIAIKHGASEEQRNFYLNEMSSNNINFSIGFSEFFGSRNQQIALETSSGSPIRPRGCIETEAFSRSSRSSNVLASAVKVDNGNTKEEQRIMINI